jgi:hypothetical protein
MPPAPGDETISQTPRRVPGVGLKACVMIRRPAVSLARALHPRAFTRSGDKMNIFQRHEVPTMRVRLLSLGLAAFTAVFFSAISASAQAELRFGVWDNTTNPNNVMTYEPYEKGGSKLTVSNPSKPGDEWGYVTLFDGQFRPVTGQPGSETAVELINGSAKSIRIYNKRDGVVYQVVINTLSDDNNTINNEYIRMDKDGKITGVTHVTYKRRVQK